MYVCMYVMKWFCILYTDDVQLLYRIYFYTVGMIINQTNRYMLFSLNINYAIKTLNLCTYVCMYVCTICDKNIDH